MQENDIYDDNNSKNILLLRSKTSNTKYNNSYPVEYHLEGKKKQILNPSHTINLMPIKCKYDYLKNEFEEYEKNNNGVFPISLFEDMLNEINVNPSIIRIIGSYLTLKAKKSFFNFDLFKEILTLLTQEESNNYNLNDKYKDNLIDGLFTLFSYPNDYIAKNETTLNILSKHQNWITVNSKTKDRRHPLEKNIQTEKETTSKIMPEWMESKYKYCKKEDDFKLVEYYPTKQKAKQLLSYVDKDLNPSKIKPPEYNKMKSIFSYCDFRNNVLTKKQHEYYDSKVSQSPKQFYNWDDGTKFNPKYKRDK